MVDFLNGRVRVRHSDKFFINGEWVLPSTGGRITLVSPVTEQPIGMVAEAAEADVDRAVSAAREAFDTGPWPKLPPTERAALMRKLAQNLTARADELAHAWTGQTGILYALTSWATPSCIGLLEYQANNIENVVWEEARPTSYPNSVGMIVREPVGVVATIAPWNAPLFSLMIKMGPALAAGCTIVMKPAPETPLEAYVIAECAEAAGFPAGVINLVAANREISDYLVGRPGVDKISFTGSTLAGKRIASVCADRIARYTLELGGKSPAILLEDMEVEEAAELLAPSLTAFGGEYCTNLTRYLVPRSKYKAFVDAMVAALERIKVGDPYDNASQLGPLAMSRQLARVEGYIRKGLEEGATLATGGKRPSHLDRGFYIQPTLFTDVDNLSTIAQEEIFGPVAGVTPYEDLDHAITLANQTKFGLAGAIFTHDRDAAYRIARSVRAGTMSQNGIKPDFGIAFGGFKESGIGREGGPEAINAYLETKTIILDEPA